MNSTGEHVGGARTALLPPLLVALAHFAAAAASLTVSRWSNGLASIWLPNAILLAYLLLAPRRQWGPACALVTVSGILANAIGGAPPLLALLFGATNSLEPLIIALMLDAGRRTIDLERIDDLLRFVAAAVIATMISATFASSGARLIYGGGFTEVWTSWLISSFLGTAIVTPLLLIGHKQFHAPRLTARQLLEGAAVLGLVAFAGAFAFFQSRWFLFFTLQPPILIATFRLRAAGAATSVLLLALMGTVAVMVGSGVADVPDGSLIERLALLQAFLAVAILTALPVAAMLSERDRFAISLAQQEADLASVVDAVSDVIFRTNVDGRWIYLNPAWEQLTGFAVEEVIGRSVLDHVAEDDREGLIDRLRGLTSGLFDSMRHQLRFRNAAGDFRWVEVQARRLEGPDGEMVGSAGIIVDISDRLALAALAEDARQRAEREAEAARLLAATDDLTGIASRRAFLAMLEKKLERGGPLSVALFDLDHFKRVNDSFGHAVGDEVLRRVAVIAQGCVRDGDLVGRLGGEEFGVLMPGASISQAVAVGERLRKACADAKYPPGLTATISVGVAEAGDRSNAASLLREADTALYQAKFEGRNCLRMAA